MSAKTLIAVSFVVVVLPYAVSGFSIKELIKGNSGKRSGSECPAWHPFQCPNGDCVPIKYLCDGSPDCSDGYDENESMCTAATRPPVEETASFLTALLTAHGDSFLSKVFGEKAANSFAGMGGVEKVAVALSQSPTADVFSKSTGMSETDETKMITAMQGILDGSEGELSPNESADFAFFVQKLHETGFF